MQGVKDLLGKPFSEEKCWELCQDLYRRNGYELPFYGDLHFEGSSIMYGDKPIMKETKLPLHGCLCLYDLKGHGIDHVAVYVGCNQIFHATRGAGACIEKYSKYLPRLKGMYIYG